MRRLRRFAPVQARAGEGGGVERVGWSFPFRKQGRELDPPAGAHLLRELSGKIAEEQERRPGAPFLAHEQQRHLRAQQQEGLTGAHGLGRCQRGQSFAESAVADLVVVLEEADERRGRQVGRRLAARRAARVGRRLALIGETLGQGAPQPCRRIVGEIGIVAGALAGERHVQRVMQIVVPLRLEQPAAEYWILSQQCGSVPLVLDDQVNLAWQPPDGRDVPARP